MAFGVSPCRSAVVVLIPTRLHDRVVTTESAREAPFLGNEASSFSNVSEHDRLVGTTARQAPNSKRT
jgi:hypothetical protein